MSIRDKIDKFMQSPAGQQRIQSTIQKYLKSGVKVTKAGSKLVTEDVALELANALADMIVRSIPGQISGSVTGMVCEGPYLINGGSAYEVRLGFTGDLSRPSLDEGGGITNIVALFNNGYLASDYVYGWWDGHEATGDESKWRSGQVGGSAFVRSKLYREPLQFMQEAVFNFNSIYGKQYNITVTLGGIYNEVPTLSKATTVK